MTASTAATALYRHYGENDVLLYVGVSLSVVARLHQHAAHSAWHADIRRIAVEWFDNRAAALRAETDAIQSEQPLHNVHKKRSVPPVTPHEVQRAELMSRLVTIQPMYSLEEAARALKVSAAQMRRWVADGTCGHIPIGTRKRVSGWQLIDLIEHLEAL